MPDSLIVLEILLRGLAIGALATTATAFGRSAAGSAVRVGGVLFCASVIAYALNSSWTIRAGLGPVQPLLHIMSLGGVGAFWLLVRALFEDRALTWSEAAPFAGLTALGVIAMAMPSSIQQGFWVAHNLIQVGLAGHALWTIQRGWRDDLVEARRRLRGPFLAVVALFVVIVSGFQIGESLGIAADWYPLAGAAALAAFCLGGALILLETRSVLFGASAPPAAPDVSKLGTSGADRAEIARLTSLMTGERLWSEEGLTIGALAARLGAPEHRVRRLINDQLGHRNFAAFVNSYRIDEARRVFADPDQARKTVSSIAFDLGFGSLGPFNRAFRETTGLSPTEWRRQALQTSSLKPEKPL
ncbi:MAG: helix-turn-helix domain-containing protein [Alphaproteobacteria bacterium]|nr:helix-turn-helix domain-containing protein [Alphaproteobacteria bacterium]